VVVVVCAGGPLCACADDLSVAGCVVTYVVRVWEDLAGTFVDNRPVDVTVGANAGPGATTATVVINVPCPVPNNTVGGMAVLVTGRDGAGNLRRAPVQSAVWVRDTVPPVTVAALAHPEALVVLSALNVSVTNSSGVALALASPDNTPVGYRISVARTAAPTDGTAVQVMSMGGVEIVQLPWDGAVTVAVVRFVVTTSTPLLA
jgi:hypothetical protein